MRLVPGTIILLVTIFAFATFNYYHIAKTSEGLLYSLSQIKKNVELERWEKAGKESVELKKRWEKADRRWTPFMDHREIDMLDEVIVRVYNLVEVQKREEIIVEVNVAERMVKRIRDREGLNLRTIF